MTIDNVERSYVLRFPPKYDGTTRLPMVMLLHGANDSADYADRAYHFDEKSTAENFILVLPGRPWANFTPGMPLAMPPTPRMTSPF